MSIDTSKSIKQVTYNGTVIPLVGSGEKNNFFVPKPHKWYGKPGDYASTFNTTTSSLELYLKQDGLGWVLINDSTTGLLDECSGKNFNVFRYYMPVGYVILNLGEQSNITRYGLDVVSMNIGDTVDESNLITTGTGIEYKEIVTSSGNVTYSEVDRESRTVVASNYSSSDVITDMGWIDSNNILVFKGTPYECLEWFNSKTTGVYKLAGGISSTLSNVGLRMCK